MKSLNIKNGDKVKINKIGPFWFPDMVKNAKNLDKNKIYTIKNFKINSSWIEIFLEETGDKCYNWSWFKRI